MSGKEAVRSSYGPRVLAHRVLQIGGETWRSHHSLPITAVAFSPDGKMVEADWEGVSRRGYVATGKRLRIFETFGRHWQIFAGLAFSPDGKMVACKSLDMIILLWDAATGERLRRLEGLLDWR